jgi:integrase
MAIVANQSRKLSLHKFPDAQAHDGLWASAKRQPMTADAVFDRICRRTAVAFGHSINPHLFRDCAATTMATRDPAHVLTVKDLLGHLTFTTTERYYNQARTFEAGRRYQGVIHSLRQRARKG